MGIIDYLRFYTWDKETEHYLKYIQSAMSVRDYLASIWSITQGAAAILNSTYYQRYLGERDSLRVSYIEQVLALPKY